VPITFKDGIRGASVRLEDVLSRLDVLVNWEKRSRSGEPGGERGRMRVSLEPARDLCARLGNPERRYRVVHVAGSKGKGSVSALVAEALLATGRSVGLYTSPHVEHVQERLRLDGEPVEDEALAEALEASLAAHAAARAAGSAAREATWFDVLTGAAFLALARAEVDWAVIECGLGGRLDSTNVVESALAVITNIYLEHTAILGATRAAIAAEKAGIVKPGRAVVFGALAPDDEAARVIADTARARGSRAVRVELAPADSVDARNLSLARAALAELARAEPALADACAALAGVGGRARLPGRAERRRVGEVRVLLDGAHVPESLELVLRDLAADPELAPAPVVVIGMGLEKDARGLLKALVGRVDRVLCTSVGEGPYRGADELAALAVELGLAARAVPDPAAALDEAVRVAGTGSWVLVTGSLHLVGAVRGRTQP